YSFFLVLLILGLLSHYSVQSLRFEVKSGEVKCIHEDIRKNSMSIGNYSIVNPNEGQPLPESHKLIVRVDTPSKMSSHFANHVESGQFKFETTEEGNYVACFWGVEHHPKITLSVDFEWGTGVAVAAKTGFNNVAKRRNVDAMTVSLFNLVETVTSIHEEMTYIRNREFEDLEFTWATNTRMAWLGLLSFFVCFSVAGLQLWHLKTFFEKKKII
ncbi:transmembrane emp24 domain-containing protein p24delta9-like, partial [Lotus japonicus]|uniref:transmembrane emp24 domain-containing protein p24delta9-like n=1 Tax=Lotus japonicus TaxID=34305 RepID=UPI00258CCA9A